MKVLLSLLLLCLTIKSSANRILHSANKHIVPDSINIQHPVIININNFNLIKNTRLDFYYHDSLGYGHSVALGAPQTNLIINSPTLLFEANSKQTPFLIKPGENIYIKYAGTDSVQLYIKDNDIRTNELNLFRKLVLKTGNIYYTSFNSMPYQRKVKTLADLHASEQIINDIKNTRIEFLQSYKNQFNISDNFFKLAFKAISSSAITDTLLLYMHNNNLLALQLSYKKQLAEKISSLQNLGFEPNQLYFNASTTIVSLTLGLPSDLVNSQADFDKRFAFIKSNFRYSTRDFLLSNLIYSAARNNISISNNYWQEYNTLCHSDDYKQLIKSRLNNLNSADLITVDNDKVLMADGKTVKELQQVINQHKGEVILIDFWASWCPPCRGEMPYLKKLEQQFQDKKLVFISISLDKQTNDWVKATTEESLGYNNYLLLNSSKSDFVKKYNITSIPRYLLISKDGKTINKDAPRPSDPSLAAAINRLL